MCPTRCLLSADYHPFATITFETQDLEFTEGMFAGFSDGHSDPGDLTLPLRGARTCVRLALTPRYELTPHYMVFQGMTFDSLNTIDFSLHGYVSTFGTPPIGWCHIVTWTAV